MSNKIKVSVAVNASIDKTWKIWNDPKHIIKWCTAHPDWHTPSATNDLKVGGKIYTRMEAKDGSMGFDSINTYDMIEVNKLIKYHMKDGRQCTITFAEEGDHTTVTQVFDPESENSIAQQQEGWQNIMNNFKSHIEKLREEVHFLWELTQGTPLQLLQERY